MRSVLLLVVLTWGILPAQDYRAKVQGLVTDATQAVVVNAKVTLHNDNTGVEAVKMSNEAGLYGFDFVEPGTYTVTVEQTGFAKFVQQNVVVMVRGDVTVNAALAVGGVAETVTVQENVVALQFNTSTMELTIDRKMLTELPVMQRNPFTLALLDPAVVNRYWDIAHRNPFYMWSSSQLDVGGNTTVKNDLLLDGAPLQIGQKGSYSPPMDAVQEFSVQQNSVDAEFGHSAGGILSVGMKSGTNEFHGTAYYFGRNPKLNAVTNSVTHTPNQVRNHIWGGSLGNPIQKNKLFAFTAYEAWRSKEPNVTIRTMPTDLERSGDFSQSRNTLGGVRTIYDPWSTIFNATTGSVVRTAFANNRIPASRIDPTASRFMRDIWKPNLPGDAPTGVNNFKIGYSWPQRYWNFSERIDWNVSDKLKLFGRYSRVRTDLESDNYANTPAVKNDNGGVMNNRNIAGDVVYLFNANTIFNGRFAFASLEDDYNAPDREVKESGLGEFWPNNPWYKPYIGEMPRVYYPSLSVGGGTYGMGSYWYQHPRHYTFFGSIRTTRGIHNLKTGIEGRRHRSDGIFPNLMNFYWYPSMTADTFISPDTRRSGDDWAAFLLGALDNNSIAQTVPFQRIAVNYWAGFIQDDIKLTPRITLNLGLRYEYEGPPTDDEDRLSRYPDLENPIPEMQANPPRIPADVAALMKTPYKLTGAWIYADKDHRGMYDTNPRVFSPRTGIAIRLSNSTAIRAGWARYVTPPLVVKSTLSRLPMWGFSAVTRVAPMLEGIPGARISDPFPASNPLILPVGKQYGRYTNLGDSADWTNPRLRTGVNDRFNISLQRQLPNQVHLDVTWFMNFGHDLPYTKQLNLSDPQLSYTYKTELNRRIPNPFYQYLTPDKFPGALRNQATVTVGSLLRTYPQYGSLAQENTDGVLNRYRALQIRVQRPFSRGYTILLAYNYNQEKNYEFFNADDQYANRFTFQDNFWPRHRVSAAGTYELPFGKGRQYLNAVHPVVNGILGGWSTSGLLLLNSGRFLRFGQMITDGSNPRLENPTRDRMFDTSKFQQPQPFTPRTNPLQYPGVVGPKFWSLDMTVSKFFPVRERFRLEFKFEAYNVVNNFVPSDPNMSVLSPLFGRSTSQANRGREMQYTLRLHF